jgi:NAD(P)-dependent dehydrogenase (short-subunit alcohol dehydrogenase family)
MVLLRNVAACARTLLLDDAVRQDGRMGDRWTADRIPDQSGRTAVVTGANSGIGLVTALELARAGAAVVLACRNVSKGTAAVKEIQEAVPGAEVEVQELDLSSLVSVRQFADALDVERLDLLVNNAGIMWMPQQRTQDGFELQFGTNHLGHFALTGLLLVRLQRTEAPRVVTVSSNEHRRGHIDFDDLQGERRYGSRRAYRQSKVANIAFGLELDRRLRAAGSPMRSVLAHPGYTATNLQFSGPTGATRLVMKLGNALIGQSAAMGALPTLYAATAPDVEGGQYFGPDQFREHRGHPTMVQPKPEAADPEVGRRLWSVSEELTGVTYDFSAPN